MDVKQLAKTYDAYIRAPKYTANGDAELFCICRKPDTGELMVGCDGCDDWFHFKCMKLDVQWKSLVKSYYCPFCHTLKGLGTTVWKRKCRLNECFEPIMEQSAFCSESHGRVFWNRVVNQFGKDGTDYDESEKVSMEELATLVQLVESKNQLDKLGDELPLTALSDESSMDGIAIREYKCKIEEHNGELLTIKKHVESLESKKVYLIKVRDFIIKLNEILNDVDNNETSLNETENQTAPTRKKAKRKSAGNKKLNIEICGYDNNLNREWDEFAKTEDLRDFINLTIEEEARNSIKEDYFANYRTEGIVKSKYLKNICMNDKKKCIHSTWFNLEKDDVDIKLDILNTKMEEIKSNIDSLNKLIRIQKLMSS